MTIATAVCVSILYVSVCAGAQDSAAPVIACNLNAIGAAERPRYINLMKRLRAAVRARTELSDGFSYKLDESAITRKEIAEWIAMERLCCPFLVFRQGASGKQTGWALTLTGPAGVKALLLQEFPGQQRK